MSKRKVRTNRKARAKSISSSSPSRFAEIDLVARSRSEIDSIASAIDAAPVLDRDAQRRELFPYSSVASSTGLTNAILRIVEGRDGRNNWIAVYRALEACDDAGDGFNMFMALYREATFQAGVEYAFRSFPDWWVSLHALPNPDREALNGVVRRAVRILGRKGVQ